MAFNDPSAVRVYRINRDFTPGEEVQQPSPIDAGIYAHQVRTTPDNRLAILVTRGNPATATKAGDPGALKVFDYRNGLLTKEVSIAPNGGKDFGSRHLDFHLFKPWMYVSIETQNKMFTYLIEGGRINSEIAFREETWAEPNNIRARQAAGTVHVHPNGRFLYGANCADATVEFRASKSSKAVKQHRGVRDQSINRRADPDPAYRDHKIFLCTFHIDTDGRLLVAEYNLPVNVQDGDRVKTVPADFVGVPHWR